MVKWGEKVHQGYRASKRWVSLAKSSPKGLGFEDSTRATEIAEAETPSTTSTMVSPCISTLPSFVWIESTLTSPHKSPLKL